MILAGKQNFFQLVLDQHSERFGLMKNRLLLIYWVLNHIGIKSLQRRFMLIPRVFTLVIKFQK